MPSPADAHIDAQSATGLVAPARARQSSLRSTTQPSSHVVLLYHSSAQESIAFATQHYFFLFKAYKTLWKQKAFQNMPGASLQKQADAQYPCEAEQCYYTNFTDG